MKQFLLSAKTAIAAIALTAGAAFSAQAATTDLGVLEPGVTYTIPPYATVTGQYTPSSTGTVRFHYSGNQLPLYSAADHSEGSEVNGDFAWDGSGGKILTYNLDGGHTYYLYDGFTMQSGTLIIEEGSSALKLVSVSPSPEAGNLSVSNNYFVDLQFNYPVVVGNAFLIAGEQRKQIVTTLSNTYVTCNIASAVMDLYNSGTLKGGDKLTLRVMNIRESKNDENKYGENGMLEVEFTMDAKPAQLIGTKNVNINGVNVLSSYYQPGDPDAIMTLEFSEELDAAKIPSANITYGNPDNAELNVYTETIPGTIQGKNAIFDFSGKLRRPADMIPGSTTETQPEYMFVAFANIYSADGQHVYTGSESNPYSFGASFKINVLQYTLSADFTPARGSDLKSGQELEIWVMNGRFIKFDGVLFTYEEKGEKKSIEVPYSEIRVVNDEYSENDMSFFVTVPEMNIDAKTPLEVTLKNMTCADGLSHEGEIKGDFNALPAGVEGITMETAGENFDVYNVAGVLVLRNANAAMINTLAKGIYVANGKKFIVK
ncbi:MAG: hypothetical protein NC204_04595 [Candidatus Amulumruptor caecigallinarius]|nr:hypothetical protein [Candidatus Amulumruptor caecigallinarius]